MTARTCFRHVYASRDETRRDVDALQTFARSKTTDNRLIHKSTKHWTGCRGWNTNELICISTPNQSGHIHDAWNNQVSTPPHAWYALEFRLLSCCKTDVSFFNWSLVLLFIFFFVSAFCAYLSESLYTHPPAIAELRERAVSRGNSASSSGHYDRRLRCTETPRRLWRKKLMISDQSCF